jgi:hypothetical protein
MEVPGGRPTPEIRCRLGSSKIEMNLRESMLVG